MLRRVAAGVLNVPVNIKHNKSQYYRNK